jgi:lipopolysaccharide/colanic/teichoic acid biosynthesis glycosyltransferase
VGAEAVADQIRALVGGECVDELRVEGGATERAVLDAIVRCGRVAGRPVRVFGPLDAAALPPPAPGERWVRQAVSGMPSLVLRFARPPAWQLVVKRLLDLLLASALAVLLSPLLIALALLVRASSPGPALYRWRVLGRNGRPFTGYKFRTMVEDADRRRADLIPRNEMSGPVFKLADDPRLTAIGRWLRRYSLDELPQLWSVVKGDMSLVGPRPAFREEYRQFELWQMRKLSVTPGLTCLWQVRGRNAISHFADWARLDLQYIDEWSLGLDVKILAQTMVAVIKGTGR